MPDPTTVDAADDFDPNDADVQLRAEAAELDYEKAQKTMAAQTDRRVSAAAPSAAAPSASAPSAPLFAPGAVAHDNARAFQRQTLAQLRRAVEQEKAQRAKHVMDRIDVILAEEHCDLTARPLFVPTATGGWEVKIVFDAVANDIPDDCDHPNHE